MTRHLLKADPTREDPAERAFDRAYYRSLTTAERFRMIVERSTLLLRLAEQHASHRKAPRLTKRS